MKMDLLKKLESLEVKEELAEQLKYEELPLVMWGSGQVAVEVNNYLKMNDISLADVFVDDEYYSADMMLEGKHVLTYSELTKKYAKVNVILGSSNYEKIAMLEKRDIVNKVFYLFSVTYGIYDKTPLSLIHDNIDEFELVYQMLEDEISRGNYMAFLKTRLSGNNKYILDVYENECTFFHNDIFCIGEEEVFLDVGAYDGDTIRLFLKENNGKYKHIYALEPDDINRNKLEEYVESMRLQDVIITEKGAWNETKTLCFSSNEAQLSCVSLDEDSLSSSPSIMVEPLDTLFEYSDKITMLKINYLEGVEEALLGAEHILRVHEPKIAITVGFDCRNIRSIPILIKKINPNYKLYLRYNRAMVSALTLYGIV